MVLDQEVIAPGRRDVSRAGFFARVGAVIIGAAAAGTLAAQEKASAAPPVCCYGLNACSQVGCGCGAAGSGTCCWWCQQPGSCHMYECCDKSCSRGSCICSRLVCTGCC
jgi:hypothetical protein